MLVASMSDTTALLEVTESFYGAALGTAGWSGALARLGDLLRADHLFVYGAGRSPFLLSERVDERELGRSLSRWSQYHGDGPSIDRVRAGSVVTTSMLMPDELYVKTRHFNELIRPLGGRHAIFAKATSVAGGSAFYVCRGARRGDFGASEAKAAQALLPHLSLAIALRGRIAKAAADAAASLLETFDGPALICEDDGRLVGSNAKARALLAATDGIAVSASRLVAMKPDETAKLSRAVAEAALPPKDGLPHPLRIRLQRRGGRLPLSLRLVPAAQLGEAAGNPRAVAIFIGEPDADLQIDRGAVAEAFGLAPREVEIAALLAIGRTVQDIAAETGLRPASVRTYLKRIFYKTHAQNQSALVALLSGFR
jgi:DNA-binding CsgD family transcriptional regulator